MIMDILYIQVIHDGPGKNGDAQVWLVQLQLYCQK